MVGRRFSLACLILLFCVIKVRCDTTARNKCGFKIPCDDSQCIDRDQWCDKYADCIDESDEKYCEKKGYFFTVDNKCDAGRHFTCGNRMCIPEVLTCDGENDCEDNSDEQNCGSSGTVDPDSLSSSSSTVSTHSTQTEILPYHQSTTEFPHYYRSTEPAVNHYDYRRTEGGNTQEHHHNSPDATASAHPFHSPGPTPDSRFLSTPTGNRDERSSGNSGRYTWPKYLIRGAPASAPSQEPCDKRPDDDDTIRYLVPWSRFTFESINGEEIAKTYYHEAKEAQEWLLAQRDGDLIWGENTPRALVALSLSSDASNNLAADDILQRRLRIALGVKLIKRSLSTSALALYINALIATCQDPRNTLERNLVEMLYQEMQGERAKRMDDGSPFPYLTLCLADRALSRDDRVFLLDVAAKPVTDEISKDKFILATSALACLKKTLPHDYELERSVEDAFHKLQQQQLSDGSFGSVYSTALASQAFLAIDSRLWDFRSTLNFLSSNQRDDGSFGDFLATYYALPVLNGKSLLHLRNVQCQATPPSPPPSDPCKDYICHNGGMCYTENGSPFCKCTNGFTGKHCEIAPPTTPPTKEVQYTLKTENPYRPFRPIPSLHLTVPKQANFLDIMKEAQAEDDRFRFLHVEHDHKIDVYEINKIPNDPEFGMFWILYQDDGSRYTDDIRKLIPNDGDELIFTYKHFKPIYL